MLSFVSDLLKRITYPTHFENFEKKFEVAHFKFIELNSKNKKELGEKLTTKLFKERKGKTKAEKANRYAIGGYFTRSVADFSRL